MPGTSGRSERSGGLGAGAPRRTPVLVALALSLLATLLVQIGPFARPANALPADDATADTTATINGITMKIRALVPTGTRPSGGWPLMVIAPNDEATRCFSGLGWATRMQFVSMGYVVISSNGRGAPSAVDEIVNTSDSGATGCSAASDVPDGLDDSGSDFNGPVGRADVSGLITWALNTYHPGGCTPSTCVVNDQQIAVAGASSAGGRAFAMGLPNADSRVKAIIPAIPSMYWTNTPTFVSDHELDPGYMSWADAPLHTGWNGVSDSTSFLNWQEFIKDRYLNQTIPSTNNTGAVVCPGTCSTVVISGSPGFTAADAGKQITIAGVGPSGTRLSTTITTPITATSATLVNPASQSGTSKRVSWGTQAWLDDRTIVDNNSAISQAATITKPTFVITSWLDGRAREANPLLAIEAWKAMTSNSSKYLYVGTCGHPPDPCGTNNAAYLRGLVQSFLGEHVTQTPGVLLVGPVFYQIPPGNPFTNTDNWAQQTQTSWPPAEIVGSPVTLYLKWNGSTGSLSGTAPATGDTATKAITNNLLTMPQDDYCAATTYGSSEHVSYTSPAAGSARKISEIVADLRIATNTTRIQVVADMFEVNPSTGTETRIFQERMVNVPFDRNATPNSVLHFVFHPGTAGWTLQAGNQLRLKVATSYRRAYAAEPLPSTYTIYHDPSDANKQSKLIVHYAS